MAQRDAADRLNSEEGGKLPTVGLKSPNDLDIALRQNKWLGEILERFEEMALPDSWLAAGSIAQTI